MFDAIALAKAAKKEEEEVKKKPFIIKFLKGTWKFITCKRALFLFSEDSFVRVFVNKLIITVKFILFYIFHCYRLLSLS